MTDIIYNAAMNRMLTFKEFKTESDKVMAGIQRDLHLRYELVPAVAICCICDKHIEINERFTKVLTTEKRITIQQWAHTKCSDGLAGKP
jgi:hypothetical protein